MVTLPPVAAAAARNGAAFERSGSITSSSGAIPTAGAVAAAPAIAGATLAQGAAAGDVEVVGQGDDHRHRGERLGEVALGSEEAGDAGAHARG